MTHIPNPIYENTSGRTTLSLVSTILITGGLFLLIPITQLSSEFIKPPAPETLKSKITVTPPPKYEPPQPPDEKKKDPQKDIDMEKKISPISIRDIGFLMGSPGTGGVTKAVDGFNPDNFYIDDPVYVIADLDAPPKAIVQATPTYPAELKRTKVEGQVVALFIVGENGKIRNIRIENATHREFAIAVQDALSRAQFEPGKINNKDVATRVRQTFSFNLKN